MYDPQLGVFHTPDRFTEKYSSLSPYQYAGNNPILLIDMNGDSLAIDPSIYSNKVLNQTFQIFANSKAGRAYLSKYAKAGQTLYGHTFKESGEFDKKGINMAYKGVDSEGSESGSTGKDYTKDGATISIEMNINKANDGSSENVYETVDTYAHESFIHGDLLTKDYLDNSSFDYSNVSKQAKDMASGFRPNFHHYQVYLDFNKRGYNTSNLWPGQGYFVLQQANSVLNLNKTPDQIVRQMWNYSGGVKIDTNGNATELIW